MADIQSGIFEPATLPYLAILLRMLAATGLGAVIGFEREREHRAAGLRTHMLVALAAAVFTLLLLEICRSPTFTTDQVKADPARIVQAVTAGVAFLAAGAIIRSQGHVRGLTTGAGLWLAGAIGMASGLGYIYIAVAAAVIALFIIIAMRWIEPKEPPEDTPRAAKGDKGG
jgi:putative Mg2+ transporter-C (MgtC) family protein